ncbi:MAG: hypothetical protein IT355_01070 [Gemmatimonadaceae bacterium]|nr:hypothetical protein [Gemmatimonadaceae bacterium]
MDQDQRVRLGGVFFVVMGGVLGWLSIWRPYQEALGGSPTVQLNRTGIGLAILLPLMGVLLAAGGDTVVQHLKANTAGRKTPRGWLYIGVIAAIALGAFLLVQAQFESMGYTI